MRLFNTSAEGLLGKILRLPLKAVPNGKTVRILQGPLQGTKWILGSSPHSCWLGIGEREKLAKFVRTVKPGDVVYDLGANVGFYAILAARLVGSKGRVIAFEPSPRNLSYLKRHLALNGITNVEVHAMAIAEKSGTARFNADIDPVAQRLSEEGNVEVEVCTLDELVAEKKIPRPNCIKIDVEGAELRVLEGAKNVFADAKPPVFIETHNRFVPRVHEDCEDFMRALGYNVEVIGSKFDPTEIYAFRA